MWLNREERLTLAVIGAVALVGLGGLLWQRQKPPLTIEGAPMPVQAARWDQALEAARQVDINTADVAELERLPDVGPALAGRIIEYRKRHGPFHRPEDLEQVKGIGPKKYETVQDHVTVVGQ